jgi:hypothetical protein
MPGTPNSPAGRNVAGMKNVVLVIAILIAIAAIVVIVGLLT